MAVDEPDHPLDRGRYCVLVTGAPGSGKSTVARLVADSLRRSAILSGDQIGGLVVSGHVWALGEPRDEAARQVALCNRNLSDLAATFMAAGFTPIIDWVVASDDDLDVFCRTLGERLRLVVLDPDAATCIQRNHQRRHSEQFEFSGHAELREGMRSGFGELGWWLDSSQLTAAETARQILDHAHHRAAITA